MNSLVVAFFLHWFEADFLYLVFFSLFRVKKHVLALNFGLSRNVDKSKRKMLVIQRLRKNQEKNTSWIWCGKWEKQTIETTALWCLCEQRRSHWIIRSLVYVCMCVCDFVSYFIIESRHHRNSLTSFDLHGKSYFIAKATIYGCCNRIKGTQPCWAAHFEITKWAWFRMILQNVRRFNKSQINLAGVCVIQWRSDTSSRKLESQFTGKIYIFFFLPILFCCQFFVRLCIRRPNGIRLHQIAR